MTDTTFNSVAAADTVPAGRGEFDLRQTLNVWYQRWLSRKQLAALSDDSLADIGVSRADAGREAAKPFWAT